MAKPLVAPPKRARELTEARVFAALDRLYKEKALHTLIRGTLAPSLLKRLLKPELGRGGALGIPEEAWASLAAKFALESSSVGMPLAEALSDRLGWDREPERPEDWPRLAAERPLEALWVAALSEDKAVRKGFPKLAAAAIQAFRSSPACPAPSWTFVDMVLELQASYVREIDRFTKETEDLERKVDAERHRSEDLREESKRLRRENAELRAERAAAEKRAAAAEEQARTSVARTPDQARLEEAERRLRKAEKEAEHLRREIERRDEAAGADPAPPPAAAAGASSAVAAAPEARPSIANDPNPRRRVLRQILKKLFKKGKIGASHTHEDNVYRGVADHEKGIAKEAMDLLYREGLLMPKPTTTDPHVSLRPERTAEALAIVAGEIENPRLVRFVDEVA